ncbi:MAG: hypothetical protein QM638_22145 [Nocardioides sp.]|uniref:protein kinase family protein n=1 Tax=Nocardioides sp. TaxID=35761 RepID=UPI0039E5B0E9
MESTRAGDVLAGRYHLVDLLSEARDGRFWRADDRILGRPVAIHVLDVHDERAPRLLAAARASATVNDPRLLRVLDAATTDAIAYVVNEWGSGISLDNLLAAEGPRTPRQAAWILSEVTDTLSAAHRRGHAHGRLSPENILIDDLGAVRIIGFAVEAALYGLQPHPMADIETDCVDAAALLYAALTGKWAGRSPSRVPAAPTNHGRLLRPRQVVAGVPRVLDDLCTEVLRRGAGEPASAAQQHAVLAAYVGEYAEVTPTEPGSESDLDALTPPDGIVLNRTTDPASSAQAAPPATQSLEPAGEEPTLQVPTEQPAEQPTERSAEPDEAPEPVADEHPDPDATEPGLPVFDDDWSKPRADPAPPPPPFEPPTPKPLFADEPRQPRESVAPEPVGRQPGPARGETEPPTRPTPVDQTGAAAATNVHAQRPVTPRPPVILPEPDDEDGVPGRRWLRAAMIIGLIGVLLVCAALGYNLSRGKTPFGQDKASASPSATATPKPSVIKGVTGTDYDPYGDPPEEYPDLVSLTLDGNATTAWRTQVYLQQLGPSGLKTGVGLVYDLHGTYDLSTIRLRFIGTPTTVRIYVSDTAPGETTPPSGKAAGSGTLKITGSISLSGATGRYVTVWLTSLPAVSGGYRGEVAEVTFLGTSAG